MMGVAKPQAVVVFEDGDTSVATAAAGAQPFAVHTPIIVFGEYVFEGHRLVEPADEAFCGGVGGDLVAWCAGSDPGFLRCLLIVRRVWDTVEFNRNFKHRLELSVSYFWDAVGVEIVIVEDEVPTATTGFDGGVRLHFAFLWFRWDSGKLDVADRIGGTDDCVDAAAGSVLFGGGDTKVGVDAVTPGVVVISVNVERVNGNAAFVRVEVESDEAVVAGDDGYLFGAWVVERSFYLIELVGSDLSFCPFADGYFVAADGDDAVAGFQPAFRYSDELRFTQGGCLLSCTPPEGGGSGAGSFPMLKSGCAPDPGPCERGGGPARLDLDGRARRHFSGGARLHLLASRSGLHGRRHLRDLRVASVVDFDGHESFQAEQVGVVDGDAFNSGAAFFPVLQGVEAGDAFDVDLGGFGVEGAAEQGAEAADEFGFLVQAEVDPGVVNVDGDFFSVVVFTDVAGVPDEGDLVGEFVALVFVVLVGAGADEGAGVGACFFEFGAACAAFEVFAVEVDSCHCFLSLSRCCVVVRVRMVIGWCAWLGRFSCCPPGCWCGV